MREKTAMQELTIRRLIKVLKQAQGDLESVSEAHLANYVAQACARLETSLATKPTYHAN